MSGFELNAAAYPKRGSSDSEMHMNYSQKKEEERNASELYVVPWYYTECILCTSVGFSYQVFVRNMDSPCTFFAMLVANQTTH